jgi:DNA-binding NtrC family response regulator
MTDTQQTRPARVLVVDDEPTLLRALEALLRKKGHEVTALESPIAATQKLAQEDFDVALLDVKMPQLSGLELLNAVKHRRPEVEVIMMTGHATVETALAAVKAGAYDYLTKPFDVDDILMLVERALEKRALEREVLRLRSALAPNAFASAQGFEGMVGRHAEMTRIYQLIGQLASTPTTVLITGESGTGKELVARAIHNLGDRKSQPFVAVNVAAIPDALLESELFGHEKGAFTGAHARKLGKFELAHGGTIFLDEIGSLRLELQAKLLRALQQREIERVGGVRPVPVDARVIAATNVNLKAAVRERTFRDDLFYRLNVVPIHVPPLRDRREDIPWLIEPFVRKVARECHRDVRGVSAGALEVLTRYDWPGNVRELENVIHRAVVLATGPVVQLHDVPLDVAMPETGSRLTEDTGLPLRDACEQFERQYVLRVLERVNWNVSRAARLLGVHRNTVLAKLSAWGVRRPADGDGRATALS